MKAHVTGLRHQVPNARNQNKHNKSEGKKRVKKPNSRGLAEKSSFRSPRSSSNASSGVSVRLYGVCLVRT